MNADLLRQLADNLQQQVACTRLLVTTLTEEKQALLDNDIIALERVSTTKASAADMLRDLGVQLVGVRTRSGTSDMKALLALCPGDSPTLRDWEQLLGLAAKCQRANRENAALLEARHAQVRTVLRQLRGSSPPPVYGRRGDAGLGLPPQRLGAA